MLALSCQKAGQSQKDPLVEDSIEVVLTPYSLESPAHFPQPIIPDDNPPYVERILLGRKLYYDPILSQDGRSCASCHQQTLGFTTHMMYQGMPVLPHVNLAWNTNFMWNGSKQGTLEEVMLFEVQEFFQTDLNKINQDKTYKHLFRKHFGVSEISYKELAYALAQFVRTMISRDSKYDRYMRGLATLSYDELEGRNLFFSEKGDCYHCHINPILTDNLFHNIGLDSNYNNMADRGLFLVTGNPNDIGKFRTPNLRNVALRSHYMHDGRFTTLKQVIDFYNNGVHNSPTLDPIMTKPGKENGLNLTEIEKLQLVAFLHTFTDSSFLQDTSLSRP